MLFLWFILVFVLVCFLMGVILGAPYLPTLNKQIETALDLAELSKDQVLIELGSGDGRVLIAAAKLGIKSVGYELNPILVIISYLRTVRYRGSIRIIWANYWRADWPQADAVFVFLIERYMKKLDSYLLKYKYRPVKLISFAFKIPGKTPTQSKAGVYIYQYK